MGLVPQGWLQIQQCDLYLHYTSTQEITALYMMYTFYCAGCIVHYSNERVARIMINNESNVEAHGPCLFIYQFLHGVTPLPYFMVMLVL